MKINYIFSQFKIVLIVITIALAFFFLTGAIQNEGSSQIGRYRLSVTVRNNFTDLYVIDTATGVVKWVGDDQGKPFEKMEGR